MPRNLCVIALGLLVGMAAARPGPAAQSPALRIEHDAIGCATVDRFVRIDVRIEPVAEVADTRVLFRAAGSPDWYWVAMKAEGTSGAMRAYLPKPTKRLAAFEYYIEAQTKSFTEARTGDQRVDVVAGASCARSAASAAASPPGSSCPPSRAGRPSPRDLRPRAWWRERPRARRPREAQEPAQVSSGPGRPEGESG
jgi:hypothetical protein